MNHPEGPRLNSLASYKYTGVQIFMNKRYSTTVFDSTRQNFYQFTMTDCIKEFLQIHIDREHITSRNIFATL